MAEASGSRTTGDRETCRPPVLKTGTITGPHALPHGDSWQLPGPVSFYFLLWLRHDSQIRFGLFPSPGIFLLSFFFGNRRQNDNIVSLPPVHGRRDFVFGGELHGIDHA